MTASLVVVEARYWTLGAETERSFHVHGAGIDSRVADGARQAGQGETVDVREPLLHQRVDWARETQAARCTRDRQAAARRASLLALLRQVDFGVQGIQLRGSIRRRKNAAVSTYPLPFRRASTTDAA